MRRKRERRLKRELSNALLVLIAIIPTHLLFQIQANPAEVEFQGNIFKLRKRNKIIGQNGWTFTHNNELPWWAIQA